MHHPAHELCWTGLKGLDAESADPGFKPGGVILFSRNLDPDPQVGPARCHAMLAELQRSWSASTPLALALDQEGGPVSRLKPWTGATPALKQIWDAQGAIGCTRWGSLWGRGLRLLGFNVDFAPVADLWDGHQGTGLGDRCASSDPIAVAEAAGAFLHGLESTGVRGCLKHFPGLGGTQVDSHAALPTLENEALIRQNLRPFTALAHEARLMMVAHLQLPGSEGRPASLHRAFVADNPWGIRGAFIPDDLEMGGCAAWSWDERVRWTMDAGHMALLVCQTEAGWQACAEAAARLPVEQVNNALTRFTRFRNGLPTFTTTPFDLHAWTSWLEEVRAGAAMLES